MHVDQDGASPSALTDHDAGRFHAVSDTSDDRNRDSDSVSDSRDHPVHRSRTGTQAQCHVDACSRFYSSFDAADCTYQPYGGGPRQRCAR